MNPSLCMYISDKNFIWCMRLDLQQILGEKFYCRPKISICRQLMTSLVKPEILVLYFLLLFKTAYVFRKIKIFSLASLRALSYRNNVLFRHHFFHLKLKWSISKVFSRNISNSGESCVLRANILQFHQEFLFRTYGFLT